MLRWPLLAACLLLAALPPPASAGSSSVSLSGADRLDAATPISTTLGVSLALDGVLCTGEAEIPVLLRLSEIKGMHSASLSQEKVAFRIAGGQAATQPWRGDVDVALRIWASEQTGRVSVVASYALPPQCQALGGATSGETTHAIAIDGPEPMPLPPQAMPQAPPAAPKSESLLAPASGGKPTVSLPMPPLPVLFAILGMIAGGAVVFYQRMRTRAPASAA